MDKFWKKVDIKSKDDYWEWQGPINHDGYGVFNHGKTRTRAHRKSWELTVGPIPEGMVICHKCDNPRCVNPSHLFIGTIADNNADMVSKNRQTRNQNRIYLFGSTFPLYKGENHPGAKLKQSDVDKMRFLHSTGEYSIVSLSKMFNCGRSTAGHIVRRTRWNT